MGTFGNVYRFYRDGFARMSPLGRLLWVVVIVKLAIMFLVLKIFFFPNFLSTNFDSQQQKVDYVTRALTGEAK